MSSISRLLSYIIAFGMLIPSGLLYAKLTPEKLAHQELISLREYARSIKDNLEEADNLIVDSYMDFNAYRNVKAVLSLEQQARLLTCAQIFDKALINKHINSQSTQRVETFFNGLNDEIEAIRAESFSVGTPAVRKHPKHSWAKVEKEAHKKNKNSQNPAMGLSNDLTDEDTRALQEMFGKDFDPKKLEQALDQLKNPSAGGILDLIKNNKKWVGVALATAYALLAKANDWPPYGPDADSQEAEAQDSSAIEIPKTETLPEVQSVPEIQDHAKPLVHTLEQNSDIELKEPQSIPDLQNEQPEENIPAQGWGAWLDSLLDKYII